MFYLKECPLVLKNGWQCSPREPPLWLNYLQTLGDVAAKLRTAGKITVCCHKPPTTVIDTHSSTVSCTLQVSSLPTIKTVYIAVHHDITLCNMRDRQEAIGIKP